MTANLKLLRRCIIVMNVSINYANVNSKLHYILKRV